MTVTAGAGGANTISTYTAAPDARFAVGDAVRVRRSFPPGHRRTPYYVRGRTGVIERICGSYRNPEELAYGFDGRPERVLYRVRFEQPRLWPHYRGASHDVLELEIYEHWLEPVGPPSPRPGAVDHG